MGRLTKAGFGLAARTRLRKYLYHRYDYSFSPRQLAFLVDCLDRTAKVPGAILEVGCAYGHTTVFLNRHLTAVGDGRPYICVDTFAGFTESDAAYEITVRKKPAGQYRRNYADASLQTFERTMANNGITTVATVKADVAAWEPELPDGISFCLVDVDLYLPVMAALKKLVPLVQSGGIMVVDDCQEHPLWDGALQAYNEFTASEDLPRQVVEGDFGLIEIGE